MKFLFKSYLSPEEKKRKRKQLLLGLISGVLLGLSFPPVPVPYFAFVALIPYLFVIESREGLGEINRFTYFTMFFFNITTLYWVGSWTADADPFLLIAGTLLMFWNPILFLIPSTFYYLSKKYIDKTFALYGLPVFWIFYEYIYTVSDFRFPWLTLGNSQPYFLPFIQIADIIGVYGLTLIILYINIFLFKITKKLLSEKRFSWRHGITTLLLFFVPMIYGAVRMSNFEFPDKKASVGLIQPNLNPWKKWDAGNLNEKLDLYFELSQRAIDDGAEIVVWPESALPVYLLSGSYQKEADRIHEFVDRNNVHLITGMPDATFYFNKENAPEEAKPTASGQSVYVSYNSILYFSPRSKHVAKYGKIKLVPFGEKVPLVEYIPFLGDLIKWNVGITSWNTGKEIVVHSTSVDEFEISIGGVICIESIYPDFCAEFVSKGANILVVVTNDSWYGNSSGPYQHKEFSVIRAVENRRSVVRAANGGISCYIDPLGNTIEHTEMFTKDYLVVEPVLNSEMTFYTKYHLLFPIISIIGVLAVVIYSVKEKYFSKSRSKLKGDKDEVN